MDDFIVKYDWTKFAKNEILQAEYQVEVKNRFDILCAEGPIDDIQEKYDVLVKSIEDSTKKLVDKAQKKRVSRHRYHL